MIELEQWGTFDLDNYGDLLFPLVLERELGRRLGEVRLGLASPNGGPFPPDPARPVRRIRRFGEGGFAAQVAAAGAIVLGGGDLVRSDDASLGPVYGLPPEEAVAQRLFRVFLEDLGLLARFRPVVWNAVGVPFEIAPEQRAAVRRSLRHVRSLSVRDELSRQRLLGAGVEGEIQVVPDTGLLVRRLFAGEELAAVRRRLAAEFGLPGGGRLLAVQAHLVAAGDEERLAEALLAVVGGHADVAVALLPICGYANDLAVLARIHRAMAGRAVLLGRRLGVAEVTAVIAGAAGFVGSSLHGTLTAFAHGVPGLILAPPAPPSKLVEYARLLGRETVPVGPVAETAARIAAVLGARREPDAAPRAALERRLDAHFDRLAEAVAASPAADRDAFARLGAVPAADAEWIAARLAERERAVTALTAERARLAEQIAATEARLSWQVAERVSRLRQRLAPADGARERLWRSTAEPLARAALGRARTRPRSGPEATAAPTPGPGGTGGDGRSERGPAPSAPPGAGVAPGADPPLPEEPLPDLAASQWWGADRIAEYQSERLRWLVAYVWEESPFYRDLMRGRGLRPSSIQGIADLAALPIVDRAALREHFDRAVVRGQVREEWYTASTTGEPFRWAFSARWEELFQRCLWRGLGWAGIAPETRLVTFYSTRQTPVFGPNHLMVRHAFDVERIEEDLRLIEAFRPEAAYLHATAAHLVAEYLRSTGRVLPLRSVVTTSEPLVPDWVPTIEAAFCCRVFDNYGCNDGGAWGAECPHRGGFHHDFERGVIEFVDGRMLSTDLWNTALPFLRYENGDLGEWLGGECPCGRAARCFRLHGRAQDVLITPTRLLTPTWVASFFRAKGMRDVRVVQHSAREVEVLIVREGAPDPGQMDRLHEELRGAFAGMEVRVTDVAAIPPTLSGKHRLSVNRSGLRPESVWRERVLS